MHKLIQKPIQLSWGDKNKLYWTEFEIWDAFVEVQKYLNIAQLHKWWDTHKVHIYIYM